MTVVAAVIARLEAVSPVVALVGNRITGAHLDQDSDMPAVGVYVIGRLRGQHLRGPDNIQFYRIQVDSVATSKTGADALAEAVEGDGLGTHASGLMGWKGPIGSPSAYIDNAAPAGEREHYDPPPVRQYRIQRDYIVSFREA